MNLKKNHKKLDKKRRIIRRLAYIVGTIALFLVLVYAGARTLVYVGQKGLYSKANSSGPKLDIDNSDENSDGNGYVWQDGWVRYNGDIYEYNEDILKAFKLMQDKYIFKEEYTKDLFPETIDSILYKFIEWLKAYNLYDLYTEKWKCK